MTEKKARIMDTALKLFAEQGYQSTSTGKLAKEAEVSEGLIFRHFENKEGLLQAILRDGAERQAELYSPVLKASNPAKAIQRALDLPLKIPDAELAYWRLVYALRWSLGVTGREVTHPIQDHLKQCMTSLGMKSPRAETRLVQLYLDGVMSAILLENKKPEASLQSLIKQRYQASG